MKSIKIILISILVGGGNAFAQYAERPKLPSSAIMLGWDNDFVFHTDYYYTNGMSLQFWNNALQKSPLNYLLIPNNKNQTTVYGISLRQDMFTPVNKTTFAPQIGDRPYFSYWLLGETKQSYYNDETLVITSSIYFGLSGEKGGGEWVQNWIHDLLPNSGHVNGWANQITGSFCLDYQFNLEKQLYRSSHFRLNASAGGLLGLPYTNIDGKLQFYFGRLGHYPNIFFTLPDKSFQIYGFTVMKAKWVIYNASLQGPLFNKPPSDLYLKPLPFVFQAKFGMNIRYKHFTAQVGVDLISPEFSGARWHRWGAFRFFFIF